MDSVERAPEQGDLAGGGIVSSSSRGIGFDGLHEELLQMFDSDRRPRLRPLPNKCRQFLSASSLNGKVLYESHTSELRHQDILSVPSSPPPRPQGDNFNDSSNFQQSRGPQRPGYRAYISRQLMSRNAIDEREDSVYPTNEICWQFHLKEHECTGVYEESAFAGCRNLVAPQAAIRSKSGTIRGVTNRVRQGIATFLHNQCQKLAQQEVGRVVVYVSTLGIIRDTHKKCGIVTSILRTLLVHFDEKDVFLSRTFQEELKERMALSSVDVPHVFVEGQHLGNAEAIERLNETGQLRQILRPYKRMHSMTSCGKCGGFRLLPCSACNGSKKSGHRNTFTREFLALRCMQCDESGLVKCNACAADRDL